MSAPGSWIEVDRSALAHNVALLRSIVGSDVLVLVPVKADGYGHGAVETARTVLQAGADRVGVARMHEGAELRRSGFDGPVHVLEPLHPGDVADYAAHGLIATVCDATAVQAVRELGPDRVVCHLKVNTGMSRLGLHHERDLATIRALLSDRSVRWEGVFTHFSRADEPGDSTLLQIARFDGLLAILEKDGIRPPLAHASNSAATLLHPAARHQMVRPGLAVYGYDPTEGLSAAAASLRPALSLWSTVRHLTWVEPGEEVSYGGMWTAARRTRLAVIPLGYGDGFWRSHSGNFEVEIRGVRCRQVGRICMDLMMVDVTDVPDAALDDRVCVIGPGLPAERLSKAVGTIVYEVTCDLGRRLQRHFI